MQIDPERFLDDGYVILKNVIPPERLDALRASFEVLVDRQHAIWARDPDDPSSMAYKVKQPRLSFQTVVDVSTANTVESACTRTPLASAARRCARPTWG